MTTNLPLPATYHPFTIGKYSVLPGLHRFSHAFGNDVADQHTFQIDTTFESYRATKLLARANSMSQHVLISPDDGAIIAEVCRFIAHRLVDDHPQWFRLDGDETQRRLNCMLTDEVLCFDSDWQLNPAATQTHVVPAYTSALDALACHVQEDLAIVHMSDDANGLSALHVCFPSAWNPVEKMGRDFAQVHQPVPGMEPTNAKQDRFVNLMVNTTDGRVRFTWGIQWDDQLNRHKASATPEADYPPFDPNAPAAYVRVERQTMWGLPEHRASLFTIRPYLYDLRDIKHNTEAAHGLADSVESMSPESLSYKGLKLNHRALINWLRD